MPWIRTILAFVNDTPTQNRGTWVKVTGLTTYGLASSRMVVGPIYGIGESGKQSLGSSDARETNRLAPHERVPQGSVVQPTRSYIIKLEDESFAPGYHTLEFLDLIKRQMRREGRGFGYLCRRSCLYLGIFAGSLLGLFQEV